MTTRRVTRSQAKTLPQPLSPGLPLPVRSRSRSKSTTRSPIKASIREQLERDEEDEDEDEDVSDGVDESGDDLVDTCTEPQPSSSRSLPPPAEVKIEIPQRWLSWRFLVRSCVLMCVIMPMVAIAASWLLFGSLPPLPSMPVSFGTWGARSGSSIESRVYHNTTAITKAITAHHPAFAHWSHHTLWPALRSHFHPDARSRSQGPLVLFLAVKHSNDGSHNHHDAVRAMVDSLHQSLYPHPALPSYLLDLTKHTKDAKFNSRQLEQLIDNHAEPHSGHGIVYLPSLDSLKHRRTIGERLQRYLDSDDAPHPRLVYVLTVSIGESDYERIRSEMERELFDSGVRVTDSAIVRAYDSEVMRAGLDELSRMRDADTVDPMLERIEQHPMIVQL